MKRFLVALAALCCIGASTAPYVSIVDGVAVTDDQASATLTLRKSAKASSYSQVYVDTADGTAKAGVDYKAVHTVATLGNSVLSTTVAVPIIARPGYQGTRAFVVTIRPKRFAQVYGAISTVTINDNEAPPPPPPPPVQCPDGSTVPAGSTCPAPPPPSPTWVPAPMAEGGYVRVKAAPDGWTFNGYPPPAVGSVWYLIPSAAAWIGDTPARVARAVQPIDQIGVPFTARYVWLDDLEGVAKSSTTSLLKATSSDVRIAVATKTCMTHLGGASVAESRSGVVQGRSYRVSSRWAGVAGMVGALSESAADGMAVVPDSCFSK